MALPTLRDLEDYRDVKGGSPRTPSGGIPVAEYQAYAMPPVNGNGNANGVWKAIACGLAGTSLGLLVAWFGQFQNKGVSMKDLQEYEDKYSPYVQQRDTLALHNSTQDTQIGNLQGVQQRNIERLNAHENRLHDGERDILDLQNKVKLFGDYVEGQRNPKK